MCMNESVAHTLKTKLSINICRIVVFLGEYFLVKLMGAKLTRFALTTSGGARRLKALLLVTFSYVIFILWAELKRQASFDVRTTDQETVLGATSQWLLRRKEEVIHRIPIRDPLGFSKLRLKDERMANVNNVVQLKAGYEPTKFDELMWNLQMNGSLVVHQTWKDTCVLSGKIPYMRSWVELEREKGIKIVYWTDESMERWVQDHFEGTRVMKAWRMMDNAYQGYIKKPDFFRSLVIYVYGGVYADLDIELVHSMRDLIDSGLTVLAWEKKIRFGPKILSYRHYQAPTFHEKRITLLFLWGFIASGLPNSDFLGFAINWVTEAHLRGVYSPDEKVIYTTGPAAIGQAYVSYIHRVEVQDHLLRVMTVEESDMFFIHHTQSTWAVKKRDKVLCKHCTDVTEILDRDILVLPYSSVIM